MKKKNKKNKLFGFICNNYLTFFVYCVIGWLYEVIWLYNSNYDYIGVNKIQQKKEQQERNKNNSEKKTKKIQKRQKIKITLLK